MRGGQEFGHTFALKPLTNKDGALDVHRLAGRFVAAAKRRGALKK